MAGTFAEHGTQPATVADLIAELERHPSDAFVHAAHSGGPAALFVTRTPEITGDDHLAMIGTRLVSEEI